MVDEREEDDGEDSGPKKPEYFTGQGVSLGSESNSFKYGNIKLPQFIL